jgi:hypothetical protein
MFKIWKWLFNPDWFTLHLGGGGGGGSSAPASQTQIADLPEWAKPYAKETLGKAAALTDISQNPYQVYSKDRIAGFDPMQEQAMRTASSPEEFGKQVQGYMSPYMQNVVDVQKREAMRSAGILGAQQQARATGAGAFGGYREGIQRAEDNRNLMRQMGDIQAMGSQRAFEQGSEEARRAQGLQMQYGGMRQGLEQQRLSQGYQDFLNQQKYPYQQLEFMSNILRGTPMGSVQTLYQPPPNVLGQLAGLGVGLGAMTGFGRGFAEGGQVDEYAGGGVTSDYSVDDIIDRLSDAQLQQSRMAALNRGDNQQLMMIDDELAERASLRAGLGGAFDSLPAEDQERVFTAANGGIVAFANGGVSPEFGGSDFVAPTIRESSLLERLLDAPGRIARGGKSIAEYYGGAASRLAEPPPRPPTRPFVQPLEEEEAASASRVSKKSRSDAKPAQARARARAPAPAGATNASITQAVEQMADKVGVNRDSFMEKFKELRDELNQSSKEEMKSLLAEAEKSMGGSKEVKERAFGAALADFGFQMAAAASKPGATFLGSASAAAPTISASMAGSAKLAREMDQNDMKLRMSLKQFEIAQRKGDLQTAAALAGQVRALEQSQAQLALQREQLDEQRRSSQVKEGLMRQRIAAAGPAAQARSSAAIMKNYGAARERALDRAQRLAKADFESAALNPAMQKMFKDRGITSSAQLYELYAERELGKLNKGFISNVTPDDSDDDE